MLNTPLEMATALIVDCEFSHKEALVELFDSVKDGSYSNVPSSYWAQVVIELNKLEGYTH
jgi:hypothetical protein